MIDLRAWPRAAAAGGVRGLESIGAAAPEDHGQGDAGVKPEGVGRESHGGPRRRRPSHGDVDDARGRRDKDDDDEPAEALLHWSLETRD